MRIVRQFLIIAILNVNNFQFKAFLSSPDVGFKSNDKGVLLWHPWAQTEAQFLSIPAILQVSNPRIRPTHEDFFYA